MSELNPEGATIMIINLVLNTDSNNVVGLLKLFRRCFTESNDECIDSRYNGETILTGLIKRNMNLLTFDVLKCLHEEFKLDLCVENDTRETPISLIFTNTKEYIKTEENDKMIDYILKKANTNKKIIKELVNIVSGYYFNVNDPRQQKLIAFIVGKGFTVRLVPNSIDEEVEKLIESKYENTENTFFL